MNSKEIEFNKRLSLAKLHPDRSKERIIQRVLLQEKNFGLDFVLSNLSEEARRLCSFSSQVGMYIHKAESFIKLKQFKEILIGKAFFDFPVAKNIAEHFVRRFPQKKIIIIDENSGKAFVSEGKRIKVHAAEKFSDFYNSISDSVSDKELEKLFGVFYDSQNIEARRNKNYALRMMPKKYWKNFGLREAQKIERGIPKQILAEFC